MYEENLAENSAFKYDADVTEQLHPVRSARQNIAICKHLVCAPQQTRKRGTFLGRTHRVEFSLRNQLPGPRKKTAYRVLCCANTKPMEKSRRGAVIRPHKRSPAPTRASVALAREPT